MRIQLKDLAKQLNQKLSPFYFVFGEEPLQHQEALDTIREQAKKQGVSERESLNTSQKIGWEDLNQIFKTPNLFGSQRIIEYCLEGKITKETIEFLRQLSTHPIPPDILFVLIAQKIDFKQQQSPWFTKLERLGCTIFARPLSYEETLKWLQARLTRAGLQTNPEVLHLLWERTEGNLLASAQWIEKLALYKANDDARFLGKEDIEKIASLEARFSLFDLIDAALLGSATRTFQILSSLKGEGVDLTLLIWAIAKEVRTSILLMEKMKEGEKLPILFQQYGVWKRRETLLKGFIDRMSVPKLHQILLKIKSIDEMIKGRTLGNAWDALSSLCLMLTGHCYE